VSAVSETRGLAPGRFVTVTGVLPIITPRLRLRPVTVADADTLATYRSDPVVAEFQDWPMPYDTAGLLQRLQDNAGRDPDLAAGANLGIEVDGTLVGDVYVRLDNGIAGRPSTTSNTNREPAYPSNNSAAPL
jgi:RimJ/RimL family protein N-acetyltransferase